MRNALLVFALRLVLAWIGMHVIEFFTKSWATAVVYGAPLAAALLARPLLDLLGSLPRAASHHALRHVAGRHYAYRERAIDIVEDPEHVRWLSIVDVRRSVPGLPDLAVLRRLEPAGCADAGPHAPQGRIASEALARVLAKTTDAETARFLKWLERDVTGPARRLRARAAGEPIRD